MSILRSGEISDYEQVLPLKISVHNKHAKAEGKFYKDSQDVLSIQSYSDEVAKDHVLVLDNDGIIVAYVFILEMNIKNHPLINDQKILYIDDLCVSEERRGKGIGTELFSKLLEYAKIKGYSSLELSVWDFNEEAQNFYSKMGMRRTRIRMIREL